MFFWSKTVAITLIGLLTMTGTLNVTKGMEQHANPSLPKESRHVTVIENPSTNSDANSEDIPIDSATNSTDADDNIENCTCKEIDNYGKNWAVPAGQSKTENCCKGPNSKAFWTCDYEDSGNGCRFRTSQPDFSNCTCETIQLFIFQFVMSSYNNY